MSLTLYNITDELRAQMLTLADHDLTPEEAADTLEAVQAEFESKIRAVVAVSRELDAEAAAIDLEAKRLAGRAKSRAEGAKHLRAYALRSIQATGYAATLRFQEFTVSVAKNPQSLLISEEIAVPAEFLREIPARKEPDRIALMAALKAGREVPGVTFAEPTFRLSVR